MTSQPVVLTPNTPGRVQRNFDLTRVDAPQWFAEYHMASPEQRRQMDEDHYLSNYARLQRGLPVAPGVNFDFTNFDPTSIEGFVPPSDWNFRTPNTGGPTPFMGGVNPPGDSGMSPAAQAAIAAISAPSTDNTPQQNDETRQRTEAGGMTPTPDERTPRMVEQERAAGSPLARTAASAVRPMSSPSGRGRLVA